MTEVQKFQVGDWVRLTGDGWAERDDLDWKKQHQIVKVDPDGCGWINEIWWVDPDPGSEWSAEVVIPAVPDYVKEGQAELIEKTRGSDPVSPNHYQFPGGAEVSQISGWLTANAAQALQYIARSSRIDGNNKTGDPREDLKKAIRFLEFELERLG